MAEPKMPDDTISEARIPELEDVRFIGTPAPGDVPEEVREVVRRLGLDPSKIVSLGTITMSLPPIDCGDCRACQPVGEDAQPDTMAGCACPDKEPTSGGCETVPADPWAHRSAGMKCGTCMWFVAKGVMVHVPQMGRIGRCRRHAPSMNGYPVVYSSDWCGDHKLDETKAV